MLVVDREERLQRPGYPRLHSRLGQYGISRSLRSRGKSVHEIWASYQQFKFIIRILINNIYRGRDNIFSDHRC